ncbi:hypothetical protein AJ80_04561 [Polytolypa hystricis UAMH7299]|uniref:CDF family cation efflux system protein n=1 Tax=Polytolypa hystricis (strain UAMH7299) TaxID=1447883 RepID=A0A2B7Y266_POLH7|nr:hypothetical protein AJ80_04561 [Polytolypa hystricis UAMH7299]
MALSKSSRIILLLVIDTVFFFIELSVGYAVHSLALVADSFHMLNDVLSLLVGLWAVKVANQKTSSKMYTYGWQRAETLGALVNGVFLVALCLSIFLEAIQRLVEPQEVRNPKLVFVVGCFGLLSNMVGLVLFHDHSHGHGTHGHGHGAEALDSVEEGGTDTPTVGDQSGAVASVLPENIMFTFPAVESGTVPRPGTEEAVPQNASAKRPRRSGSINRSVHRYSGSIPRGFGDVENIQIHPAGLRQEIIKASQFEDEPTSESENEGFRSLDHNGPRLNERSRLLNHSDSAASYTAGGEDADKTAKNGNGDLHGSHNHAKPKDASGRKGHSHGHGHDLNMRGVFLHVVGDALGNIGVIVSALVIWLTDYSWRHYVDPGISLFITVLILCSAIPLCKAASRILLQAVPAGLSIDHITEDIEQLPGVLSCHHFHVWQLSDTKLVASLHIQVSCDIKGEGSDRYMELARQVRKCLHEYGIHSSTIQPEFSPESDSDEAANGSSPAGPSEGGHVASQHSSPVSSIRGAEAAACLLECGDECAAGRQCCPGGQ